MVSSHYTASVSLLSTLKNARALIVKDRNHVVKISKLGVVKDIAASVNWLKANVSKRVCHCVIIVKMKTLTLKNALSFKVLT
ncbi:hypothetical protein RJT34_20685 [Clitoria ternatea]|uniref:Uncharacterized protein n=1 Tax=Clitoria ternatea TaxID=43366 RepID=A0AAN9IT93_CLITE